MALHDTLASPVPAQSRQGEDAIDESLATALQRNMSFADDRKRQHTPSTANRPRRMRKAEHDTDDAADQKENSIPSRPNSGTVTPSRLACIKQLEQEMTCSVCLDICVRPCTTPCGHDFCRRCLKQALSHQRRCPKCRTNIPASAPICINTVLWNTIKLLFPHHAANAPDSPADAVLTPSRSNTAAMAHALAAVPNAIVQQMANAPFNPPRRTRALSPARGPVQRMASAWLEGATRESDGPVQRMAPSWLEGATRDSDPPDPTARRHRLAFSSRNNAYLLQQQQLQQQQQQQQTLPQAYDRWEMHAAPLPQGQDLSMDDPHLQAMQPVLVQPRRQQAQMQHPVASSSHRPSTQSSLLDSLQQRLDTLPVPHVLHGSQRFQETAAGMEHSPSLRVRPFRQPPFQVQFPLPIAPAPAMDDIPSNTDRPRRGMFRLPRVRQPVNLVLPGQHRQAEAHRQAGNAGEEGEQQGMPEELPDTPEAPRAATATQNQATADELFEAAVSESAAHASEAAAGGQGIQAEPSWLDDAAAYDAAAAEIETDGLAALEILSDSGDDDDGDASVHGARSTAAPALALTSLHQLVLSSDSEDESSMADSDVVADSDVMSDSAPLPANSDTPQHIRLRLLQRALRPRGAAEQHEQAASLSSAATAAASLVASGLSAVASARADQPASSVMNVADSPPPSSARHIGMPRAVLSDVTSSFPPQQQQQEDPPAAPAADKPCNLQRRRLVCREPAQSLLTAPDQLASSSSSAGGTSAGLSPEAQLHSVQDVTSPVAVARCTRSQVRRNKQPSTSQQALLAGSRVAEQALSNAAAVASHVRAAGSNDSQVQAGSNVVAQQSAGLNRPQRQIKNRPRLQLNRVAKHD